MAEAAAERRPFRYERKFLVEELDSRETESVVRFHPALFREVYPPRQVNNIYFDSFDARNYRENVDGLRDRVKVRIRWYGELLGEIARPILEFKIKRGLLGSKEVFRLAPFLLKRGFDWQTLAETLRRSELPERPREGVSGLRPFLLNRYRRRYFLSADGQVRLTLDADREFFVIGPRNNMLCHSSRDSWTTIVELKHPPEVSERAIEIANRFPFRLTKSSKYVQGLDHIEHF